MKLCKDCKHALAGGWVVLPFSAYATAWMCSHPDMRDPVQGFACWSCTEARSKYSSSGCGLDGLLWEEGVPEPLPASYEFVPVATDESQDRPWWRFWP